MAAHANELRPSPIAQQQEAIQSRAAGGGVSVLQELNGLDCTVIQCSPSPLDFVQRSDHMNKCWSQRSIVGCKVPSLCQSKKPLLINA
jgi:hypothetical protein